MKPSSSDSDLIPLVDDSVADSVIMSAKVCSHSYFLVSGQILDVFLNYLRSNLESVSIN